MAISSLQQPIETGIGSQPDAAEVMANIELSGKTALVTGGYSGIGLETVRALTNAGARVIVPSRDVDRAAKNLDGILNADEIGFMDLSDLPSVARFGEDLSVSGTALDIAIFNAGVMACPLARTAQDIEWQLGVNHFGHFLLLQKILPALRRTHSARVITLSSIAHRFSGIDFDDMNYEQRAYDKWQAYGQAKSAQSLMAVTLDSRERNNGIRSFAVHPGGIFTPLQRHLKNEEMVEFGWTTSDGDPSEIAKQLFKTPSEGCATSLWAATASTLDNIGGVYCEDCNVSKLRADDDEHYTGVRRWAVDSDDAEQLWSETEAVLGRL